MPSSQPTAAGCDRTPPQSKVVLRNLLVHTAAVIHRCRRKSPDLRPPSKLMVPIGGSSNQRCAGQGGAARTPWRFQAGPPDPLARVVCRETRSGTRNPCQKLKHPKRTPLSPKVRMGWTTTSTTALIPRATRRATGQTKIREPDPSGRKPEGAGAADSVTFGGDVCSRTNGQKGHGVDRACFWTLCPRRGGSDEQVWRTSSMTPATRPHHDHSIEGGGYPRAGSIPRVRARARDREW